MMDGWSALLEWLPVSLGSVLRRIPSVYSSEIHELRLYTGQAVAVTMGGARCFVTSCGELSPQQTTWHCEEAWVRSIVDRACQQSVYAHGDELRYGFLPSVQGCRIGIAGTAVTEHGRIVGYRRITSLCIRIAREHRGCASPLTELLCRKGHHSLLLCGEPSSGKTTMLRDLLREFSARGQAVTVVDERGELTDGGVPCGCDVLRGAPKAEGIVQAIRTLSPRVVVFDELGGAAEIEAVRQALYCGVPVVTSVHCRQFEELRYREALYPSLHAFTYLVQLGGSEAPGQITAAVRTEDWYENGGNAVDLLGGTGVRNVRSSTIASARGDIGTHGTMVGMVGGVHPLYSGTAE